MNINQIKLFRLSAGIDPLRHSTFSSPNNSNVSSLIVSEIEPFQAFTHILVTISFDDDSIKNKQASMEKSLSNCDKKSMGYFSDPQGQLTQ